MHGEIESPYPLPYVSSPRLFLYRYRSSPGTGVASVEVHALIQHPAQGSQAQQPFAQLKLRSEGEQRGCVFILKSQKL